MPNLISCGFIPLNLCSLGLLLHRNDCSGPSLPFFVLLGMNGPSAGNVMLLSQLPAGKQRLILLIFRPTFPAFLFQPLRLSSGGPPSVPRSHGLLRVWMVCLARTSFSCQMILSLACFRFIKKLSGVDVAAWPKALHAVSLVHVGGHHFDSLRSAAMKGIQASKPGANPRVHLSLLEFPLADPELYALWSSLRDFCTHSSPSLATATLSVLASSEFSRQPGPAGVLLNRLNAVGISWLPEEAAFHDRWGLLNPWESPLQELLFRAVGTWLGPLGC